MEMKKKMVNYMMYKIKNKCPFCGCKLFPSLLLKDDEELIVRLLCNNHVYKDEKRSLVFHEGWRDLSLLVDEFKNGNLTVIKETVTYKRFKERFKIN